MFMLLVNMLRDTRAGLQTAFAPADVCELLWMDIPVSRGSSCVRSSCDSSRGCWSSLALQFNLHNSSSPGRRPLAGGVENVHQLKSVGLSPKLALDGSNSMSAAAGMLSSSTIKTPGGPTRCVW